MKKLTASENAYSIIKEFEGCKLNRYLCPAGIPSIGYGHVIKPDENLIEISKDQAESLLKIDCSYSEKTIKNSVMCDLTQNEYDALVSFIFNIGGSAFRKSTMLKLLNVDKYSDAALEFLKWNHVNGKICDGLTRRRQAEMNLFVSD